MSVEKKMKLHQKRVVVIFSPVQNGSSANGEDGEAEQIGGGRKGGEIPGAVGDEPKQSTT